MRQLLKVAALATALTLVLSACAGNAGPGQSSPAASEANPTKSGRPTSGPSDDASPSASESASAKPSSTAELASGLGLTGMLVYHSYSEYGAWDAELYGIDLKTGRRAHLNAKWKTMISPINAHFNADGTLMTFMGSAAGIDEYEWDVFVSRWTGSTWGEPVNLTGPNGKRDEDPKFSPTEDLITYKENGVLALIGADGEGQRLLTAGKGESSMPYFTVDGKSLLFERGGNIWLHEISSGSERTLWTRGLSHAYYPIGATSERFLFTEVQSSAHDRTVWGYYDGRKPRPLFNGSNDCDNSDPYPYRDGSRFVFYVTGCAFIFKGGYNLAVLDQKTERAYDIDEINVDANSNVQELGPAWVPSVRLPK